MSISHIVRSQIERKESQIGLLGVRHCLKLRNLFVVSTIVRGCVVGSDLLVDRAVVVNAKLAVVGGLGTGGLRRRKTKVSLVTENMEEVSVTIHKMRLQSCRWQVTPWATTVTTIIIWKRGKATVM